MGVFRGVIAATSLKKETEEVFAANVIVFRGVIAAASLKRNVLRAVAFIIRNVFRGVIAAASLKHGDCDIAGDGEIGLPQASLPRPH